MCNKLKTTAFTRNIPIIMISSYPDIAENVIAEFGADDFIAKPFELSAIVNKIRYVLTAKHVAV